LCAQAADLYSGGVRDSDPIYVTGVAENWLDLQLTADCAGTRLLARFDERDERGVITTLVIMGSDLDSALLRALPMRRVVAAVDQLWEVAGGDRYAEELAKVDDGLASYLQHPPPVPRPKVTGTANRPPLTRPDGSDPAAFSKRVAEAYNAAVLTTSKPATVLAAEAGVPVTTVHRWIREARLRGHLPPAKKGRAG
jgi:hypothetical protein